MKILSVRLFLGGMLVVAAISPLLAQQTVTIANNSVPSETTKLADPPADPPASPSDELNAHLPSWLRFSGEVRLRGVGIFGDFFSPDSTDYYLLTRLRLNMQIRAASWMNFYFQGQDAHLIGQTHTASLPTLQRDTMDLRLGYIELGNPDSKPISVRVGRQELAFGEERLIGPANWLNTPRSFDAISGTFRISGVRVDVFSGSLVKIHDGQFNEATPGNYISGLYTGFSQLIPQATVEPYFFWRRQSGASADGITGVSNFGTLGFRWMGKTPFNNDYDVEVAKQAGVLGPDTVDAWAGHWLLGHTLAGKKLTPRFFAEFNYASGNHNTTDRRIGTFDQLFPSAHDLYGLTDQVGWKNIQHVRTGMEIKPRTNWTVSTRYNSYWLADPHDALYNAASTIVAKSPTGNAGVFVGQELDFISSYKFKHGVILSGGFGHLFPGTFLQATTPGKSYSFPYAALQYAF